MSFQDDIKGQNTQLYPIVVIHKDWDSPFQQHASGVHESPYIFLSTNNTSIDLGWLGMYGNYHCKPLLLNVPSIKESIDIESRKFKISNVSLDISNIEYEGKRFSDILSETSLINTSVSIYFKSPSANFVTPVDIPSTLPNQLKEVYQGIIRRISHDDTKVKIELEDLTEQKAHKDLPQALDQNGVVGYLGDGDGVPDRHKNKPIPIVYGQVDRSPCVLTGTYDEEYDFFQVSKVIIDSKDIYSKEETTISVANKIIIETPVYLSEGIHTFNCANEDNMANDGTNFIDYDSNEPYIELNIDKEIDNSSNLGLARLRSLREPIKAIARYYGQGGDGNQSNRFAPAGGNDGSIFPPLPPPSEHIYDNNNNTYWILLGYGKDVEGDYWTDTGEGEFNAYIYFSGQSGYENSESAFATLSFPQLDGDFDLQSKVFINYEIINQSDSFKLALDIWLGEIVPSYESNYLNQFDDIGNEIGLINAAQRAIIARLTPNDTVVNEDYSADDFSGGFDITNILDSFSIPMGVLNFGIPFHRDIDLHSHSGAAIKDFKIRDLVLYQTGQSDDLNKYDLFANVKGRTNTFDDHPELVTTSDDFDSPSFLIDLFQQFGLDVESEGIYDFYDYLGLLTWDAASGAWVDLINNMDADYVISNAQSILIEAGYVPQSNFIKNPIDIIYDLVRKELGHDAIDEVEYAEAKEAHTDWKFGFTINKKINSKKLIEDIAKSTKCFPKFKNDGTFGFNTIRDSYTVSDTSTGVERGDYITATLIKESEVISYSFKKTKPEQIYKKITVSYNKDYAQDSYLKTTDPENYDLEDDDYYGIEDSSDAHLEFESDYIRHDNTPDAEQTADKLASFLSNQYKNNHLIFNLKLPLKYINLDIGDLVKFEDLFQGVTAYGINYTIPQSPNDQIYYPLFMVTATTKNLDSVSVECMQLHHLSGEYDNAWEAIHGVDFFGAENLTVTLGSEATPLNVTCIDVQGNSLEVVSTGDTWEDYTEQGQDFTVYYPLGVYNVIHTATDDFGNEFSTATTITVEVQGGIETIIIPAGSYSINENQTGDTSSLDFLSNSESELIFDYTLYGLFAMDSWIKIERSDTLEFWIFKIVAGEQQVANSLSLSYYSGLGQNEFASLGSATVEISLIVTAIYFPDIAQMGDINLDSTLNILDVVQTVNYILGSIVISDSDALYNADANQDGVINILDIVRMSNCITGAGSCDF